MPEKNNAKQNKRQITAKHKQINKQTNRKTELKKHDNNNNKKYSNSHTITSYSL